MRRDPPNAQAAPARESEGPPQKPTNTSTKRKRNRVNPPTQSSFDPFMHPRLTERDRVAERQRIAQARDSKRAHLARLGISSRDRSGDLTLARARALAHSNPRWTRIDRDCYIHLIRRAVAQGATPRGLGLAPSRMRGEAA